MTAENKRTDEMMLYSRYIAFMDVFSELDSGPCRTAGALWCPTAPGRRKIVSLLTSWWDFEQAQIG